MGRISYYRRVLPTGASPRLRGFVGFAVFACLLFRWRLLWRRAIQEEESAHFITYRNNLNKIMVTPYSKQKWEIEVSVFAAPFFLGS